MRALHVAIALLAITACGEDEGSSSGPAPRPGPPRTAPAAKGKGKDLKPMRRIEDRVSCPTPTDAKRCDPKVPVCAAGQYCLSAGTEFYCGACPERDAIRHDFKPRDFQGSDLRDPFQNFVMLQEGLQGGPDTTVKIDITPKCTRKDQMVATSYAYQQLRLVGLVSQGTQRKVLMMGGNLGYIIKKGDCVGKERAVVKDIGAGYVTFQITPTTTSGTAKDPVEYSMQLYPKQISMNTPEVLDGSSDPGGPVVAPPTANGVVPAPDQPSNNTTTTIIEQRPSGGGQAPAPAPAPTQINP